MARTSTANVGDLSQHKSAQGNWDQPDLARVDRRVIRRPAQQFARSSSPPTLGSACYRALLSPPHAGGPCWHSAKATYDSALKTGSGDKEPGVSAAHLGYFLMQWQTPAHSQ